MYIAYKGFNENLECRGEKFQIGETYTKEPIPAESLRTCTSQGWHYCDELEKVFKYYSFKNSKNRFCKIEVLGTYKKDSYDGKCTTTSFKILEEIPRQSIELELLKSYKENLPFEFLSKFVEAYPNMIMGGSLALVLYGCNLKRKLNDKNFDLDIIFPYYIKITKEDLEKVGIPIDKIEDCGAKASGNDFDETFNIFTKSTTGIEQLLKDDSGYLNNYIKVDMKIDPKQPYNIVEYKGIRFKLAKPELILEAKLRYSLNGQTKHTNDIHDMLGIKL